MVHGARQVGARVAVPELEAHEDVDQAGGEPLDGDFATEQAIGTAVEGNTARARAGGVIDSRQVDLAAGLGKHRREGEDAAGPDRQFPGHGVARPGRFDQLEVGGPHFMGRRPPR